MTGDWYMRPDVMAGLDIAVLAALAITILAGLRLGWRLKALRRTHAQWNTELAAFTEKTDATEASLERLRMSLLAEAEYRRTLEKAPEPALPDPEPVSVPITKPYSANLPAHQAPVVNRRVNAVLSMQ